MPHILIVEDSPTQAQHLQDILEGAGHTVEVARDGRQGFERCQAEAFDVVLSDILMPGLTGYELCRKIKDDPSLRQVPVILLTSLTDPMDIIRGLECGADNFLTKPYQPEHLLARVKTILDNKAQRSDGRVRIGAEVVFLGQKLSINSDKEQILDLLITTFEDVVRTNRQLQNNQAELREAKIKVDQYARQLEGRVRSSEDRYHRLMEQAQDAIVLMAADGKIVEVNHRAEELFGQPAAEMIGCSYEKFVVADELDHQRAQFQKLLTEGNVHMDNAQIKRADGRAVCIDYSASLVEIGRDQIVLVILHDVTERNQMERQLHQAQKMEAIGQLAGGIAHDFNNLLTIIGGYSELLLSNRLPPESSRGLIEEIKKAGDRAAGLTRQLLAFSRQQVLEPRVLDLNAVVSDTEKMLKRLIGEDIQLTSTLAPSLEPVRADPGQVEQIIMNLAVNARDAMPLGGQLTIETSNVDLDESYTHLRQEVKPGRYAMLTVSDTGSGMDDATKARIFEPFFTTKEQGKGTGLGLATVYGIVKQSGGFIYVYSELGVGTTFKVYFPSVVAQSQRAKEPSLQPKAATGTETLLLVEDEEGVRLLTRHVLQMYGYTVLEASHAAEAIRICEKYAEPIHLVVSDVVMPGMGGRKLAEHLVTLRPGIKVLYLSGYTDDAVVRHGVLAAETAFLQKPFTHIALAQKVREVLDS